MTVINHDNFLTAPVSESLKLQLKPTTLGVRGGGGDRAVCMGDAGEFGHNRYLKGK